MMVRLTIDGRITDVPHHTPILKVAERLGISIPTLCYHEALKPYGSCRLCVVEVIQNKRSMLVTSCNYPAEEGLEVLTASSRVKRARKAILDLLLARCPNVPVIREMAKEMGTKRVLFKKKEDQRCLLCGLCVRACEEMVSVNAIGLVNRGTEREVNTPFHAESDVCIGCGACSYICPTSCIEMVPSPDASDGRSVRMGDLGLDTCPNSYKCETCDIDHQFLEEISHAIQAFRKKWKKDSQSADLDRLPT